MRSLKKLYQCTDPSPPSKSGWVLPAPQIDPPDIPNNADATPGRLRTSKPQLDPPDGAYIMRSLKKLYQCTDPSLPSKSGWVLPAPQIDPPDIPNNADTTPGRPRTSKPQLDPPDGAYTMRSLKKLYQCTDPSPPSKSGWVLQVPQIDPLDIPDNADTFSRETSDLQTATGSTQRSLHHAVTEKAVPVHGPISTIQERMGTASTAKRSSRHPQQC